MFVALKGHASFKFYKGYSCTNNRSIRDNKLLGFLE